MRLASALVLALSIAVTPAAAMEFPSLWGSGWQWQEKIDPITDAIERTAVATTTRVRAGGGRADAAAGVLLGCVAGRPSLSFLWTIKVTAKENWQLEYRFAGRPGHALKTKFVNRAHLAGTSLADIRQFLAEAAGSDRLLMRVTSYAYGTTEATFRTSGGRTMVDRFLAACPVAAGS